WRRLPARLRREPGGRPYWPGGPAFSITHAAGYAACALAMPGLAIGVDLEPDGAAEPDQLRLLTTELERRAMRAGRVDAVRLWTSKEAVLKAAGADVTAAAQVEIDGEIGHHAGRRWYLQRLTPAPGLRLTLASALPLAAPQVSWPDPAALFGDRDDRITGAS
ncbi:MAG: 4'-phosphopantetheinyl transferase superfamily protein, partial [Gammaproteobacteria bacterium]|nr:4'-phosphopantetheinyl transferase superfamily protein [Gammaproteobacteria bacterium]